MQDEASLTTELPSDNGGHGGLDGALTKGFESHETRRESGLISAMRLYSVRDGVAVAEISSFSYIFTSGIGVCNLIFVWTTVLESPANEILGTDDDVVPFL